jgi:hypothetical protein
MNTIQEQRKRVEDELHKLENMGGDLTEKAKGFRDSAFTRFPVIFVFMSTFGLVATLYGFEKVIDDIQFFSENPKMVLVAGVVTLALTGSLFKKLT